MSWLHKSVVVETNIQVNSLDGSSEVRPTSSMQLNENACASCCRLSKAVVDAFYALQHSGEQVVDATIEAYRALMAKRV